MKSRTTGICIHLSEKTAASRIVGKIKKTTVIRVSSGVRIEPAKMIIDVCRITSSIPAALAFPFMISIIAMDAEKHDVPLVISEFIKPAFLRFVKKSANIRRKKKKEITKRNLAKLFVNGSSFV